MAWSTAIPLDIIFCSLRPSSHLPFLWYLHDHSSQNGFLLSWLDDSTSFVSLTWHWNHSICLQILLGFPDCQLFENLCNFIPRIASTLDLCHHCCLFLPIAVLWMNMPGDVRKAAKINETVKQKNLATMYNVMECSSKCNDSLLILK